MYETSYILKILQKKCGKCVIFEQSHVELACHRKLIIITLIGNQNVIHHFYFWLNLTRKSKVHITLYLKKNTIKPSLNHFYHIRIPNIVSTNSLKVKIQNKTFINTEICKHKFIELFQFTNIVMILFAFYFNCYKTFFVQSNPSISLNRLSS